MGYEEIAADPAEVECDYSAAVTPSGGMITTYMNPTVPDHALNLTEPRR